MFFCSEAKELEPKVIYSAIIVLGNLMSQQGDLNRESTNRMELAIRSFFQYSSHVLITCGWAYREDSTIAIADAMCRYAVETSQITAASVLTATQSRDTVGDAVFSKRIVNSKPGWNKFLVVTSDYHVDRTKDIFQFVYGPKKRIKVIGATTQRTQQQAESENGSRVAFRNTFNGIMPGDDEAIYLRLCRKHPFYNGLIHPQI